MDLITKRVDGKTLRLLKLIGERAEEMGYRAFLVGGTVRDLMLGGKHIDIDIVVEGEAIKLGEVLAKELDASLVPHKMFGTCTLGVKKGLKIDLATARKETYAHPAAMPTVKFSSLKDDLRRRDFTINAMAMSINGKDFGRLTDFYSGKSDLKKGVIRVMHGKSFIDDPTRIFRAVRFASRLRFTIEPRTFKLMEAAINRGMLEKLSKYRVDKELAAGIIRSGKL